MNAVTRMNLFPIFVALLLALGGTSLLAGCGGKSEAPASEAHSSKEEGAEHSDAEKHSEGEGHHDEEGEGKRVELTAEQIETAGIGLAQAGPANLNEHLPLYGVIAPNAERMQEVTERFPGIIRSVKKRVGDPVRKGETLALIESNESLQTYAVAAPLDGVVTQRNANEGAQSGAGPLFTVADLSSVWVELSVFPRDLAKVKVGQTVRVHSGDTGLTADGKVIYVAPFGSSSNQTLTARVQLPNLDRKWPPGLYVTANIVLASSSAPLTIRNEAIQTLENRNVIFVRHDEGFEPRNVTLGRTDGEVSEVVSGIAAGDTYATKNSFILKAELGKGEAEHEH